VNPTFVWGYAHVILASLVTGCLVMLAVSAWYLRKRNHVESFQRTAKIALIVLIPTIVIQVSVGNQLGVIETHYQPAKIAAAEALWDSCKPCSFSVAQTGGWSQSSENPNKIIQIPHLLSVLATGTWSGPVTGLNQLQAEYQKKYGPGNYIPNVAIQYWSMRTMAGLGTLVMLFALWGGWLLYRGKLHSSRLFLLLSVWAVFTPFLMNTAGWLLTESGRQPWIVQGLQKTAVAHSPSVSATEIWISLIVFILAYIVLAAADLGLMLRYSRRGLAHADAEAAERPAGAAPALTY
jgi:cytochrome bd-type quinol oxidase subunit 1